jgi:VWFA-related protein
VHVTDKSGAPIRGLREGDFTLFDSNLPQAINSFHSVEAGLTTKTDPPQELILVIDAINAPVQVVASERAAVKKFLMQNNGKLALPTEFVTVSSTGTKVQGPSQDGIALATQLDQAEIRPSLKQSLRDERVQQSIKALTSLVDYEEKWPGRKLMIWFSPAWFSPGWKQMQRSALSSDQLQRLFSSFVRIATGLRKARLELYSVDPIGVRPGASTRFYLPDGTEVALKPIDTGVEYREDVFYYEGFLKPVLSPRQVDPANLSLQVLAIQSGGRVLSFKNDLTAAINNCLAEAGSLYVLSFMPSPAKRADEYHSLSVTVSNPKLTVRTRSGYYAQP